MKHIIVTYSAECAKNGHVDPNFTQLIYGNSGNFGVTLKKNIEPGSIIFFNARIGDKRYITAYFYVEKVLIKGQHNSEIEALICSAKFDDVIFIGSRNLSKVLTVPLVLDRSMIGKIQSYGADDDYFNSKKQAGYNELEAIRDKTLNPHIITEEEKEILINECLNKG